VASSVVTVVSQPDRPRGRKLELHASPVSETALERGLPLLRPEKARDPDFIAEIEALQADLMVVAAYGQILKPRLLEATRQGAFNLHGSLLPAYRGAAPIQHAILSGETRTGVSLMQMDAGMDTGDEIARVETEIEPEETYGQLHDRLAELAGELLSSWIDRLAVGDYARVPQDSEKATYAPKIERADAELRFEEDAFRTFCRFRAVTPTPGATLATRFGRIKVLQAQRGYLQSESGTEPGLVRATTPDLEVTWPEGSLRLLWVQPEGKKPMSGRDWANGVRLTPGTQLRP